MSEGDAAVGRRADQEQPPAGEGEGGRRGDADQVQPEDELASSYCHCPIAMGYCLVDMSSAYRLPLTAHRLLARRGPRAPTLLLSSSDRLTALPSYCLRWQ